VEIILDADVIINGEKGKSDLHRWFESHSEDQFAVAAITVAELWYGVERATEAHRGKRQAYLQALIALLPVIAYTEPMAYHHARLWSTLNTSGKSVGAYDLIVAATALHRGSAIATFNKRHFSRIRDLMIVEPK
jgi:predicted nucleic acid-binding protein